MIEGVGAKMQCAQTLDEKPQLDETILAFAKKIVELRFEIPALLFLEIQKPLTTILHTSCLMLQPIAAPLFGAERIQILENILSDRENIEKLMCAIERQTKTPASVVE